MLSTPIRKAEGVFLALCAGILYVLAFRATEQLGSWAIYSQGVYLIYLSAGIKHIAILIAGPWGALGCFLGMLFAVNEVWHGASLENMLLLCAISIGTTWTGIAWGLRLLGVNRDLQNLKFIHLPLLDLLTTGLHGITTNIFYLYTGMKIDDLKGNVLAMMLGDFTGSMLIMTVLWSALWLCKIYSQFKGKSH